MPDRPVQSLENHRSVDRGLYAVALVILLGALVGVAAALFWEAGFGATLACVAVLLFALALLGLLLKLRLYALILQDRIIRLEMQVRLERVLPKDLNERAKVLTLQQVIALRFAADRELPELVEKVLADKITDGMQIKRMIRHWQADWQRV